MRCSFLNHLCFALVLSITVQNGGIASAADQEPGAGSKTAKGESPTPGNVDDKALQRVFENDGGAGDSICPRTNSRMLCGYAVKDHPDGELQEESGMCFYTECTYSFLPRDPNSKYTNAEFEETWQNRYDWQEDLHASWSRYAGPAGFAKMRITFDPDDGVAIQIIESTLSKEFDALSRSLSPISFMPRVAKGMVITAKFFVYEKGNERMIMAAAKLNQASSNIHGARSGIGAPSMFIPHMTCVSGRRPRLTACQTITSD